MGVGVGVVVVAVAVAEGLGHPKGIREPQPNSYSMYRGMIRTRWSCGDSRKAITCSN